MSSAGADCVAVGAIIVVIQSPRRCAMGQEPARLHLLMTHNETNHRFSNREHGEFLRRGELVPEALGLLQFLNMAHIRSEGPAVSLPT